MTASTAQAAATEIAVHYEGGAYRVHSATCADRKREAPNACTYPAGSTLLDIARAEFADFLDDDPEYYTDERVLSDFESAARILPCAAALIG